MRIRERLVAIAAVGMVGVAALAGCSSATAAPASTTAAAVQKTEAVGNDPYYKLPEVPDFEVKSSDVDDKTAFDLPQFSGVFGVPGGEDVSPELSWSGFPKETKSFIVTMFDADAPTGSGFWHWVVSGIPAATTSLPVNAGAAGGAGLPAGASMLTNDAGVPQYIGAAPPKGSGQHRYVITVTALDVDRVDVPATASPALLGFMAGSHTIARATLTAYAGE